MDIKNKRGLVYVAFILLGFAAVLGISQCSDSSAYTLNPEEYNKKFIIPIVVVLFVGLMVYLRSRDK